MRLCRFEADGATHLGVLSGPDTVIDLTAGGLRPPAEQERRLRGERGACEPGRNGMGAR